MAMLGMGRGSGVEADVGYNSGFVSRRLPLLVLVALLVFLAGLGRGAIGDSDEAFY